MTSRVSFHKLIIETLRRHLAAVLITVLAFFLHIITFFLNVQNILSQEYVQDYTSSSLLPVPPNNSEHIIRELSELCSPNMLNMVMAMFLGMNSASTATTIMFATYFGQASLSGIAMIIGFLPMFFFMPFIKKLVNKFGKKESSAMGALVSVVGGFNNWDGRVNVMRKHFNCGVWDIFIPHITEGELYKFEVKTHEGYILTKSDPMAFYAEVRPNTASIVYDINHYNWNDNDWMKYRASYNSFDRPTSIYEVHLGSWRRKGDNGSEYLSYRELADTLVPYVMNMGFTHVEFLPVCEHPFDGSWGYQVTGLFAPTSRFGSPDDFRYMIDKFHQANIGVIMDWVPAHFPKDGHGLIEFDGTALYEHQDPRKGEHKDWGTKIYNYGRTEVSNVLCCSALYWLQWFFLSNHRF